MSQNLHHVDRDDLGLVLIRGNPQGQTMQYLRNLDGQFFWLCARLQMNSPSIRGRLLEAYHSRARTPGALGCGCMIGQVQCNILYQVLHANHGNNGCIQYFSFESKPAEAGCRSAIRLVRGHRQDVFRSTMARINTYKW